MTNKLAPVPSPEEPEEFDPFSPEANRVSGPDAKFKPGQVKYKEGRPRKDEFFRIHADPDYCHDYQLLIFDDGKDKETYIVYPHLREMFKEDIHPHRLYVGMNRHDNVFVWAVRLYTDGDGSGKNGGESWSDSAQECAEIAKSTWIKIKGNRNSGAYDYTEAVGHWGEPKWPPGKSFRDIVALAFKGRVIDRPDHAVITKMIGPGE